MRRHPLLAIILDIVVSLTVLIISANVVAQTIPSMSIDELQDLKIPQRSLKASSYSKTAIGTSGAYTFLREYGKERGFDTTIVRSPTTIDLQQEDVVMLSDPTLRDQKDDKQQRAWDAYLASRATLVISLPKRFASQQSMSGGELLQTGLITAFSTAEVLRSARGSGRVQREKYPEQPGDWGLNAQADLLQSLAEVSNEWEILVGDDEAAIVVSGARIHGGRTIIVSDADLFANLGLAQGDNASILQRIIDENVGPQGSVYIDEAFHGYLEAYAPFYLAKQGTGRWISLQLLILFALWLWWHLGATRVIDRVLVVVRSRDRALAERSGDILAAKMSSKEQLRAYRNLLVQHTATVTHGATGTDPIRRLQHIEELRSPSVRLADLDKRLDALDSRAKKRHIRPLLQAYQQWFTEVTHGTR